MHPHVIAILSWSLTITYSLYLYCVQHKYTSFLFHTNRFWVTSAICQHYTFFWIDTWYIQCLFQLNISLITHLVSASHQHCPLRLKAWLPIALSDWKITITKTLLLSPKPHRHHNPHRHQTHRKQPTIKMPHHLVTHPLEQLNYHHCPDPHPLSMIPQMSHAHP